MSEQATTTETEQLYDDLTADKDDEQPEDVGEETDAEEDEEELLTEEQLEAAQVIADYEAKIEQLDAKLDEFRADSLLKRKREAMREYHYNDEQIERYVSHIQGESDEEIRRSVLELTSEIPARDNYADPSLLNGAKQKPVADTESRLREIGKAAFERVRHKIRF